MVMTASPIVVVLTDGAVVVDGLVEDTVVVDCGDPGVVVAAAEVLVATTVGPGGAIVDPPPAPAPRASTATTSTARPVPPATQVRGGTLRNWSTAATTEG